MATKAKTGLVREYLEKVSGSLLEDQYRPAISAMIRGHAGVYALYKGDRLYYVGLATNLMGRVKHHLKDRHTKRWDKFSVYLTNDGNLVKPLESLLLRIADPPGNRVKGRLPGAVDKKYALDSAMAQADSNRRASLLGGHVVRNRVRRMTAKSTGTLVLAGLVNKRIYLRGEYKGKQYRATLRKDGYIAYAGVKYTSPGAAAKVIFKRAVNGWRFWHYRANKKGWVPLSDLRKKSE
jgi:hypothetical protein